VLHFIAFSGVFQASNGLIRREKYDVHPGDRQLKYGLSMNVIKGLGGSRPEGIHHVHGSHVENSAT